MADKSKNRMMSRRSLMACSSAEIAGLGFSVLAIVFFGIELNRFTCWVATAGVFSMFSMSKLETFCGLLSSRTVKSSGFKSRTRFPLRSRTETSTSTSSDCVLKVYSAC